MSLSDAIANGRIATVGNARQTARFAKLFE